MDCSTSGFPVHHQLLELTQTHVPTCHTGESPCSNEDPAQPINKSIVAIKKKRENRLPWWLSGKESACRCRRRGFDPEVTKIPWRRKWQPTPVLLPGKSHGQRSLAGYNLWGLKESRDIRIILITGLFLSPCTPMFCFVFL